MRSRLSTTFRSLRVRNYRLFATGQLVKLTGVWMQFTAQDLLVLKLSHQRPTALGTVTALQFLPVLLFTLYGGVVADRVNRRRALILLQTLFLLEALALGLLTAFHLITIFWIYALAFCSGLVSAFEIPMRQSYLGELVGIALMFCGFTLPAPVPRRVREPEPAPRPAVVAR